MADDGRNYIIDRLLSKRTTIEEFNFDALQAPPLGMFLDPWDIAELHSIATSLKLSGKPKERYKAIDDVMRRRGLVKFGAGTNRVVYRHPEFNDILFKVAADAVGLGDNPAEFRNQMILKPFVAKTFEISPCGTVALVERLIPIRNREEYLSVAEDVFELINTWIVGKYIMADIGSRYFMNIGIRKSMGVCLLDYPYLYELDDSKLFCNAPDPNSLSGYCDGEIDYDDGFNILRCKKCGVTYKAKELAKKIDEKMITVKERGVTKMNITVSGGSKNVNKQVNNETLLDIAAKEVTGKRPVTKTPARPIASNASGIKISTNRQPTKKEISKTVNGVSIDQNPAHVEKRFVPRHDQAPVVKPAPVKEAKPAVTFGDKVESKIDTKSTPVYDIEKALETITNSIKKISVDDVKEDAINRMFDKLINSPSIDNLLLGKLLIKLLDKIFEKDTDGTLGDNYISKYIFDKYYDIKTSLQYTEAGNLYIQSSYSYIPTGKDVAYGMDDVSEETIRKIAEMYTDKAAREEAEEEERKESFDADNTAKGMSWYNAKRINIKDILPNSDENCDAFIVYDDDGHYVLDTECNFILIDRVDNIDIENYELVPKSYLKNVIAQSEELANNPLKDKVPAPEVSKEVKEAPVGALPIQQSVDESTNDAMKEFVEAESKE